MLARLTTWVHEKLWPWITSVAKKVYANPTGYRLFWTGISLGAAWAATQFGADPKWGGVILLVTTVVTSEARNRLDTPEKRARVKQKIKRETPAVDEGAGL